MSANIGNWGDYIKIFLKVENYGGEEKPYVVTALDEEADKETKKLTLQLMNAEEIYYFTLNKTNAEFLKDSKIPHPRQLIGKTLYFKADQARNPQLGRDVPVLRISKVI